MSPEEAEIAEVKAALRARGWYVRYTEWPSGHQVVVHRRSDTAVHRVTAWRASEVEAWKEGLSLALGSEEVVMPIPIQDEPESTIGRKPPPRPRQEAAERGAARSGAALRHEEADESEAGSEIRDRERGEPPTAQGFEE